MFQIRAKVLYNKRVRKDYFHLILAAPEIIKEALPGQFIQIRLNYDDEPLLRRPFSIHRTRGKNIEVLYEVVGKGTEILSQRKIGEYLDIIGPLGKGFDYQQPQIFNQRLILVAGGMGVAPLIFLAEKIKQNYPLSAIRYPLVLIGAKTKSQILCEKEFKKLGCQVYVATDDGSKGFQGKVTELLRKILLKNSRTQELKNSIYACGPRVMLKEISTLSKKYGIPAQISLEEHLACGIGACLGCVVDTKEDYQRVCKEGPVFKANQIIWGRE
jgi:dihydroorotate dehydrogenase electron transfer subunit